MKLRKMLASLGRLYPMKEAEFYDHPGYQTGKKNLDKEIHKVFLCLDFTEECLEECVKFQPDLILTHHPFFFGKPKIIRLKDPLKEALEQNLLSKTDCPIYSYHTNFDKAQGGMNEVLLDYLGWEEEYITENKLLRVGHFKKEKKTSSVAKTLCRKFGFDYVGYLDNGKKNTKFAFVAGGAGNDWMEAVNEKVDIFISGDCAHHSRLDMKRYGMNYVELPHECEELGFLKGMGETLLRMDPNLELKKFAFESYFKLYTEE